MKFNLLGQFTIETAEGNLSFLPKSKISQILAVLLVQNGETVGVDTLIEELWGENVPRSALTTLQTYVYHARKMFAEIPEGRGLLLTRPSGYAMDVADEAIDVKVFERLVCLARQRLHAGQPEAAIESIEQAVDLWQGPVLAGMALGRVLDAHITYITEFKFSATELWVAASRRLGRDREVVPRLRLLVAENPLNESLHAQLIRSLHRCGRRAEALAAYRNLWRILDRELGVEPAPELQLLQHELLATAGRHAPPRVAL
ncbi:AfsR/SARP family transcriptional regulator [Actinokineospora sp. PR83]|uniref:AfsR/SARP family transcriptional regulator n=1 Tax=Actinokineospora sp. PR83 TaxID=2884908 RepID=UPI001F421A73|nr:AfsR/SARP family transcriptional regulator [Actinokineospora sp. PR83]MCG8916576.1 AfsR/SARP family transcriptional regulator [Actinokineospora sp. PR83]